MANITLKHNPSTIGDHDTTTSGTYWMTYDDIIANKILCFFWNGEDEVYDIGYLKSVNKKFSDYRVVGESVTNMGTTFDYYLHCKAVEGKKFNIMP